MLTASRAAPRAGQLHRRVLVVDDEASVRDAVGRFLRSRGFDVHVADTVASGLERVKTTRFAAIVCDVRMPGASGMDLIPEARRLDDDLAILMLTGLNDASAATEALTLGASDYLLKPVELDRLETAIGHALRRRDMREHHERWDGTGYPDRLAGDAICLGARIVAVADAYVAVTAGRAYFTALAPPNAVEHLAPHAGTQFDPDVFRVLEQLAHTHRGGAGSHPPDSNVSN